MAVIGLSRFNEVSSYSQTGRLRFLLYTGILLPAIQVAFILLDRFGGWNFVPSQLGIQSTDAVLFIAITFLLYWCLRGGAARFRWMAWCFVAVFLLSDVRNYVSWMAKPQYHALEISRDLEAVAPNGVLTGQWAPELCLENNLRTVPVWRGFVNSDDPFRKYGITHVLQWNYELGGEQFGEWYPSEFKNFRFVKQYRIKNSELILYKREDTDD
jgi:hypothetical protein